MKAGSIPRLLLVTDGGRLESRSLAEVVAEATDAGLRFVQLRERRLGRSSVESIQSGLFHGHVGAVRHLISLVAIEAFNGRRPHVIGTGGFAWMFLSENLFDKILPELVLTGLKLAEAMNREQGPAKA